MELNSNIIYILKNLVESPMLMVFFAAFGIILYMLILGLLSAPFQKLYKDTFVSKLVEAYFYALLISWILGFISQIILFFCGISGLQLLAIWLSMHILASLFCFLNYKELKILMTKFSKLKDIAKQK